MGRSDTIDEVKFLWERVSAKTAANVIASGVAILALIEFCFTVAAMVAMNTRGWAPVFFLVHAPLMGLFALMVVVGGKRSLGWLYLPFMAMNTVYRILSLAFFLTVAGYSIVALFLDDAYLAKKIYPGSYDCTQRSGLRAILTIYGIGYTIIGIALVALFTYIGNVMAEAFKATRTVQKGKVGPTTVEKGVGAYPDLGTAKSPTAPRTSY